MAVKDKLVNLEDLKVVNDDLQGKVSDLKSALDKSIAPGIYKETGDAYPVSSMVLNEALKANGGVTANTPGRAHTRYINGSRIGKAFSINLPGYLFRVFFHTDSTESSFVDYDKEYHSCDGTIYVLPDVSYLYRICFYHDPVDDVSFTSAEGESIVNALILYDYVVESFSAKVTEIETEIESVEYNLEQQITAVESAAKNGMQNILRKMLKPIQVTIAGPGLVRHADGIISSSTTSSATDFVLVDGLGFIMYKQQSTTSTSVTSGMAFYDKNKEYISGIRTATGQAQTGYLSELKETIIPNDAVYARFTIYTDTQTYGEFELYGVSDIYELGNELIKGVYSKTDTAIQSADITSPCHISQIDGAKGTSIAGRASLLKYYEMAAVSVNLPGYMFRAFYYTDDTTSMYKGCSDEIKCNGEVYILPKTHYKYVRFTFYHDPIDNINFTSAELESIASAFTIYDYAKNAIDSVESDMNRLIKREAAAMGLNTIPESIGMLNVIRRARQHTDVKWTPVADMKRAMLLSPNYTHPDEPVTTTKTQRRRDDLFLAGREYSGIPYTEVTDDPISKYEYNSTLGNLDSFVSAVQYANTMAYSDENYQSRTQHTARMGGTCVDIPLYAYEMPRGHLNTWGSRFSAEVKNVFGETYADFNPELLRQGDIIDSDSHVVMITDIARDEQGTITSIEVSENTTTGNMIGEIGTNYGGKTRRWAWPLRDFYNYFGRHEYKVYRMKQEMIDRVTYTPLMCVQIGTETKVCFDGPLPLIPENGNKSILARGPKPYSDSVNDNVILLLEKTRACVDDPNTEWNKIAVTDPAGNIRKYDINGDSLTIVPTMNGIWSACPQVVDGSGNVKYTGAHTEWYVILLNNVTYSFDGSGGFELHISHLDTDDCEPIGFVLNSTGGVVLESIANYTRTSKVTNGIRTWTITGNGISTGNNKIWHITMRTPFGLAKCVSDRVY